MTASASKLAGFAPGEQETRRGRGARPGQSITGAAGGRDPGRVRALPRNRRVPQILRDLSGTIRRPPCL